MSRTYRRTKRTPEWVTNDDVVIEEWIGCRRYWFNGEYHMGTFHAKLWKDFPRKGKDLRKHVKKYRADKGRGYYTAPSWFVNMYFTRKERSRERQELKRILRRGGDYEDYNFLPHKSGAMWEWS